MSEKKVYQAPNAVDYGHVSKLTGADGCPDELDDTFPAGTPFGEVTCS